MASHTSGRATVALSQLVSRLSSFACALPTSFSKSALVKSVLSMPSGASPANNRGYPGVGNVGSTGRKYFTSFVDSASSGFSLSLTSPLRGLGGQIVTRSMAGGSIAGARGVRSIMVEVKGNDLERALRKWRRKCKEENLKSLKDREYFKKPSEKRVLAAKERDRRIAKRSFRVKLNWIMSRRQRGF